MRNNINQLREVENRIKRRCYKYFSKLNLGFTFSFLLFFVIINDNKFVHKI